MAGRRRRRRDRLWLAWVAIGVVATAVCLAIPSDQVADAFVYDGIGLASALVILVGIRRHRPARAPMWYLFAGGLLTWVIGDILFAYYTFALHQEPFPSVADVFYLSAYPMLIGGLVLLVRGRGRDLTGLLDASIIATGLGLLVWSSLMRPIAYDTSLDTLARILGLAYPAADVLMLAMIIRIFTSRGARTASLRLLVASVMLLLGSDIMYSILTTFSKYEGGWVDAGWLLSYVAWGAAALHPSMRTLSSAEPAQPGRFTRRRLALLAVSSLLAPALLFVQGVTTPHDVDWPAIGAGAVMLFLLVVARISGLTSQVQRQADQLSALAMQDDLTGLANRRQLESRIRAALPNGVQMALVDLDDFKAINDRLGHTVGDQVLVGVANRLAAVLRPADTVARLGGDEFAVLMPGTPESAADALVQTIAILLQRPIVAGQHELLVQASIGVTDGVGTTDPFEVVRRADVAMYTAKDRGGSRTLRFGPEMDQRATEYARLGAQLRNALDANQFELMYQPIVTLPHGDLAAVETLVRWRHPRLGLISPSEFIPVAERNGLIVELGAWILWQACRQAASWQRDLGPHAPDKVSVNVSARQLAEPGFADTVAQVLAETGLPAATLAIEVTETAVFNGGPALDALNAVHRLGVQIALDDFGTGHSSLGLLQTVPVDILKVDKSFVDNITMAGRHAVIATALINVSHGLNLTAVAEGVETIEQADQLYRLGYRYAQGYHFGRPTPATELFPEPALTEPVV